MPRSFELMTAAKTQYRVFTVRLPLELGRRAAFTARNLSKHPETFLSDVVAACMEDLPVIADEGAEGVEQLLTLAQAANVEACDKATRFLAQIIEAETFPAVVAARAEFTPSAPSLRSAP